MDYIIVAHAHDDHVGGLAVALIYADAGIVFCSVLYMTVKPFLFF